MGSLTLPINVPPGIRQQFDELAAAYPGLALSQDPAGLWLVEGSLPFMATFEGETIEDAFSIRLWFPPDLGSPPMVEETGGRIPKDFHKLENGSLCLGAPVEVRAKFKKEPRLLAYVDNQVIPYLFSFCSWQKHGRMPYGERAHGGKGLVESYQDLFSVQDRSTVLHLLKLLATQPHKGHHICPCGSNRKIRNCHGPQLLELNSVRTPDQFLRDIGLILRDIPEDEFRTIRTDVLSRDLLKAVKAVLLGQESTRKHA